MVVPRILVWGSLLISAIPGAGYLAVLIIALVYPSGADKIEVRKNRFTNYWFK